MAKNSKYFTAQELMERWQVNEIDLRLLYSKIHPESYSSTTGKIYDTSKYIPTTAQLKLIHFNKSAILEYENQHPEYKPQSAPCGVKPTARWVLGHAAEIMAAEELLATKALRDAVKLLKSQDAPTTLPGIEKQPNHSKEPFKKPLSKAAKKKKTPLEIECEIIWRVIRPLLTRDWKIEKVKKAALDAWDKNQTKFKFVKDGMLEDKALYATPTTKNSKRDFINAIKKKIHDNS